MRKIYLLLFTVFTFFGCDSFLDVEPKGKVIPSTVEDYDLMLQSTSFSLSNSFYMDPDGYMPSEIISVLKLTDLNAYTWAENQYSKKDKDSDWDGLYQKLYYCNEIIEKIDGANSVNEDEDLRKKVKGQAYAQRANIYFWLVNMYAKHYNSDTKDIDPGVPQVVVNDINQLLPRATVGDIYELIDSDLEIAKELVPETEDISKNFRASIISVNALQAKVELFKGNFNNALNLASSVISKWGEKFNDFNDFGSFDGYYAYPSVLMAYGNPEFIWYTACGWSPQEGTESGSIYLSESLNNLYNNDDLRYEYWTRDTTDTGEQYPEGARRYVNWYYKSLTASISEMYLIRAECYARSGNSSNITNAINDVNTVRKYRFKTGTDYTLSANTLSEALDIVKKERRREFACTGLNWFDLRRYYSYGDQIETYTRTIDGVTYTLNPGSNRYTFSIPEYTRSLNPLLEQNPR